MTVWSLPKVFHTCGKICGKSTSTADRSQLPRGFSRVPRQAKPQIRDWMRHSGGILFAYSEKPSSIQPGILCPTAAMTSCMTVYTAALRAGRLAAVLVAACLAIPLTSAPAAAAAVPTVVWGWGINGGDGPVRPMQVNGLTGVTSVSGGDRFALAMLNDGTIWGWGYNGAGQLGTEPGQTDLHRSRSAV